MELNSNDSPLQLWHITRSVVLHLWTHHTSPASQHCTLIQQSLGCLACDVMLNYAQCLFLLCYKWTRLKREQTWKVFFSQFCVLLSTKQVFIDSLFCIRITSPSQLLHSKCHAFLSDACFMGSSECTSYVVYTRADETADMFFSRSFYFQQRAVLMLIFLLTKHLGRRLNVGCVAVREKKANQLWGLALMYIEIVVKVFIQSISSDWIAFKSLKSSMCNQGSGVLSVLHWWEIENYVLEITGETCRAVKLSCNVNSWIFQIHLSLFLA